MKAIRKACLSGYAVYVQFSASPAAGASVSVSCTSGQLLVQLNVCRVNSGTGSVGESQAPPLVLVPKFRDGGCLNLCGTLFAHLQRSGARLWLW